MNNNDLLLRLRYALDIKDTEIVKAFQLGGMTISREEEKSMLTKINNQDENESDGFDKNVYEKMINNKTLDTFLNGFILLKRGEPKNPAAQTTGAEKLGTQPHEQCADQKGKIALALTSDDLLDILAEAGVYPSKGELGAILRKEGHRNFKPCGDNYTRNFLKGLGLCYRE
jgi:uncharacterized protein YehS (DUF1456 family)